MILWNLLDDSRWLFSLEGEDIIETLNEFISDDENESDFSSW